MKLSKAYLAVVLMLTLSFLACDKFQSLFGKKLKIESVPVPTGKVIAKVNDIVITQEDLDRYVENYNKQVEALKAQYPGEEPPAKIATAQEKIDVLKSVLVRQKLLYQEALDRGLGRKPDIVSAVEDFKAGLLISELAQQEQNKISVSSQEVEDYYNKNKELLKEAEERRVRQVVTKTEADARNALIDILKGEDFKDVAKRYSIAANAADGGDLGFLKIPLDRALTKLEEQAFTVEVGNTSNIFKGEGNNYYIIKVEEKKGGKTLAFSDIKDRIRKKLEADKEKEVFDNLIGKLQRESKIEILEGEVK